MIDWDNGITYYGGTKVLNLRQDGRTVCEIDIEDINSNAEMLDWIFHIENKYPKLIPELIFFFNKIFEPQKNCCSFGEDKEFNGAELLEKFLKDEGNIRDVRPT